MFFQLQILFFFFFCLPQAEYTKESKKAKRHSQMAKKYGIISIVTLIGIIIAIPLLLIFVSYLLTLKD